jgi:hypothetical protein
MQPAIDYLSSLHPLLPPGLLVLLVWLPQYLVRRYKPLWWQQFAELGPSGATVGKVWQALPSVVAGAAVTAFSTGTGNPTDMACGALVGALAPLWHHLLKWLPGPYQGGSEPAATPASKRAGISALILFLFVGCAATERVVCSPEALILLEQSFLSESLGVIKSGACDGYAQIDHCPAWQAVAVRYSVAYTAWERCE